MDRIARREFVEILQRHGPIDLGNYSDPVSSAVRDLGITDQDLKSIGDGDLVIRGSAEVEALLDKLDKLDAQRPLPGAHQDRASRLSGAMRANRAAFLAPPPPLPSFAELKTDADLQQASTGTQARPVLDALKNLRRPVVMPVEIKDAARVAADLGADPVARGQARARVLAWSEAQAASTRANADDLAAQVRHVEGMIGTPDGSRPGYYQGVMKAARAFIERAEGRAARGDKGAQSDIARGKKVHAWAEQEHKALLGVYRGLIVDAGETTKLLQNASFALDATVKLTANAGELAVSHAAIWDGVKADIEASADAGEPRPELYDSRKWIVEVGRVAPAITAHVELISDLELRARADPAFREWLTSSGPLGHLEKQKQGLEAQRDEIDRVIVGQAAEPIKGRTLHSARREAEAQYLSRQSVAALLVEGDGQLEARETQIRDYRKDLRSDIDGLKKELGASTATIQRLEKAEKERPLTIDEVYELRIAHLKVDGAFLDDKGQRISLKQEITKLERADHLLASALTAVDGRRNDLADALAGLAHAYGHGLKPTGSNLDLMQSLATLEAHAHVPGFDKIATKQGDVMVLNLPGKDGKTQSFRLAKDSSFAEARAFVAAYAHQHAWQTMRAYEVSRHVLVNQYGIKSAELDAMGLAALTEAEAKSPGYIEKRLDKMLSLVGNVTGRDMTGVHQKGYMEWTLNPQNNVPNAPISKAQITERGAQELYRFLVDRPEKSYNLTRAQLLKIIADPMILREGLAKTALGQDPRADVEGAADAALEVVRAIARDPALQKQLGMSESGFVKSENFKKWHDEWSAIKTWTAKQPDAPKGAQTGNSVVPEFFPGAAAIADSFGPTQKHIDAGNHFFERTTWLTEGQRAYVLMLYEVKYGKEASLKVQLPNLRTSHGEAYRHFMQEKNAAMVAPSFEKEYLKVKGGADTFVKEQKALRKTIQAYIDDGLPAQPHVLKGYDTRLETFEKKNNERNAHLQDRANLQLTRAELIKDKKSTSDVDVTIAAIDQHLGKLDVELRTLGAEISVLGKALHSGEQASLKWYNESVDNMRSFGKGLAIMAAAMAATYLTAGRAGTVMRPVFAGSIALMSGTAAGATVAFAWDVGEQAADKGWRNVDLDQSKRSAVNAIPQAALSSIGLAFSLPRFAAYTAAVKSGQIVSNGIKIGALQLSGNSVIAARGMIGMGVYAGATTYIGKVGAAAFYLARNDPKENDLANARASLNGINRESLIALFSTPFMMRFSNYKSLQQGAGGVAWDAGTNMAIKGVDNWIAGKPIGDGLLEAGITGGVNGRAMYKLGKAIEARQLRAAHSEGARVRLPNETGEPNWAIKGIHEPTGQVMVHGGKPPRTELVSARLLTDANPHLVGLALKDPPAMTRGIGNADKASQAKPAKGAVQDPLLLRSSGAVIEPAQAALLFQPGSGFVLKKFVLAKDIVLHDVSVRADGTVVGRRSEGAKVAPLKNLDGSPLTALDLARTSPGALLPMGLKLHDPVTGHSHEIKDTFGSAHLFVEERNAAGKILDTTEITATELIAKGLHVDDPYTGRRAMFDAKTVDAAQRRVASAPPPKSDDSSVASKKPAPSPTSEDVTVPGKKPAPSPTSENVTVPGKKPGPAPPAQGPAVVPPKPPRTTRLGHEPAPAPPPPPKPEPTLAGQPLRVLRTDLEQHVLNLIGPTLREHVGGDVDVKTRVAANADGSVEMKVGVRPYGGTRNVAELTMTVDPTTRTVRIDDLTTTSQLASVGADRRMLTVAADFLGKNFVGWNVTAQAQGNMGRAFGQLFEQTGGASGALSGRVREAGYGLNPPPGPNAGWDNLAVAGIDRQNANVTVRVGNNEQTRPIADVLVQRPELVHGMGVDHGGARYRVSGQNAAGEFQLIPNDPTKHSPAHISAEDLYRAAPDAIDARIGAPAMRARGVRIEDGAPVAYDIHGYTLAGVDRANGTAKLRRVDNGAIENWSLDRVSYEHSGITLGALSEAQHARYEQRLIDMAHPQAWGEIRAKAVSPAHASLADQAFAADMPLQAISALLDSTAKVPQAEVGKLFTGADQVQHGSTVCVAAACLFGISRKNPMLTRFLADNPDVAAWWQRTVVEGHATGGVQNRQDGHYPYANEPFTHRETPTQATPSRVVNGRAFYDANAIHIDSAVRDLNNPANWVNREATVDIGPNQQLRVIGDASGRLSVQLPNASRATRVNGPLFQVGSDGHGRPTLEVQLNNRRLGAVSELGLPAGMPVPKHPNGMFLHNDPYLTSLISMSESVPYAHSDVSSTSRVQLFGALDASLEKGHGVPLAVNWHDPTTGVPAGNGHQLWIDQKKVVNGQKQYLVHDPWFEGSRWISEDKLYRYTPVPGIEGRPAFVSLPVTVQQPGPPVGVSASNGAQPTPGATRDTPVRQAPTPLPDYVPDPVPFHQRSRTGIR